MNKELYTITGSEAVHKYCSRPISPIEGLAQYRLDMLHNDNYKCKGQMLLSQPSSTRIPEKTSNRPLSDVEVSKRSRLSPAEVCQFESLVENLLGIQNHENDRMMTESKKLNQLNAFIKQVEEEEVILEESPRSQKDRLIRILDKRRKKIEDLTKSYVADAKILDLRSKQQQHFGAQNLIIHPKSSTNSIVSSHLSKEAFESKAKQREDFVASIEKDFMAR